MTEPVNPTPEEIAALPIDTAFQVEGVLRGMREIPGKYSSDSKVEIVTSDGALYVLNGFSYPLTYEGGCLENIKGQKAQIGETIQATVYVVLQDGVRLITIGHGHARLLKPSDNRQNKYDLLRDRVERKFDELCSFIDSVEHGRARKMYAELRKLALTKDEHTQLKNLIARMAPVHAPIVGFSYERDALEKAYGVNTDELTKDEFLKFARGALHGEIPNAPKPDRVDQSYLFRYLDEPPFTTDEYMELLFSTLKVRLARLEEVGDSHDETWDDFYLAERCVEYMSSVKHENVVTALGWLIDYCLEHDYFDYRYSQDEEGPNRKFSSFLPTAVRTLHDYAIYRDGKVGKDFDTARLFHWRNTLSAYPYMGTVADEIRAAIVPLTTR